MRTAQTKVQTEFNKACTSYELVAYVQKQAAEFLIEKLLRHPINPPKTILDLGTGTGYIPELLLNIFPNSTYLLNDISDKMLEVCKAKFMSYKNFTFLHDDMSTLQVNHCDLVISNFSLQWVNDLWSTIKKFHANSNIFAFSTLLNGTFNEWQNIINLYDNIHLNQYPTTEELIHYCNNIKGDKKLHFWTQDIPITFDNPLSFIQYLKNLGASTARNKMSVRSLKSLIRENHSHLTVSYKIFFCIFEKVE